MSETRTKYGFPIVDLRMVRAQRYAAEVRERRKQLPAVLEQQREDLAVGVQQLTQNWSKT